MFRSTSGYIDFATNGQNPVTIQSSGMYTNASAAGQLYQPTEGGAAAGRFWLMFDYTNDASYPFLTNRTPSGKVVIKTGVAAGGGENTHFTIEGGNGTVDAYFEDVNLGIGTTSPAELLHIQDSNTGRTGIAIDNTSTNGRTYILGSTGSVGSGADPGSFIIRDGDASSNRFVINSSGNVGIGTTSPGNKLEVVSAVDAQTATFRSTNSRASVIVQSSGTNHSSYLSLKSSTSEIAFLDGRYDSNYLRIATNKTGAYIALESGNQSEAVRILSDGNVGIGTTSPSSTLHVSDSTSGVSVLKVDGSSGTIFEVTDDLSSSLMSVNTIAGLPVFEVFADYHIVAGRYNQNDFYLDTNGNLGLGTGSPASKLDVVGDEADIYLRSADYDLVRIINRGTGSDLDKGLISVFDTGVEDVRIDSAGNSWFDGGAVGIGTKSPALTLHVNNAGGSNNSRFSRGGSYIFDLKIDNIITNSAIDYIIEPAQASSGILFRSRNSSNTNVNALAINRDGNVGIGTTNPIYNLDIVGSGGADDRVFLRVKSNASSGDGDAILYLDSAQAGESDIDLMHDWLHHGPPNARVDSITILSQKDCTKYEEGFTILGE